MAGITVDSDVSKDDLVIPLIDFAPFLSNDASAKQSIAKAVLDGFQGAGFIYLKNHGISTSTAPNVFSHSAKFFARPQDQKDALAWPQIEAM